MADIDDRIDELYRLPLDQFTSARNALAKELKRPEIKDLDKPNVPAWAVNQLYWRERAAYDRLVKAAERLRAEHRKLLAGKPADLRAAESEHRDAIRDAVDLVRSVLEEAGHPLTQATMTAAQETLESLPGGEGPGRLTRPFKPMGFEALSGVTIAPGLKLVDKPPARSKGEAATEEREAPTGRAARAEQQRLAKQREAEERERRARREKAEKELKAAEAAMLRAEEAVKKAERTLAELRAKRDEAVSEYQRARLRVHE